MIAAEVHQSSRTSSDLSFALFGQAHLVPGSRVTVSVEKGSKTDIIANFNVTENGLEVSFGSKQQKTYILETSTDLRQWDTVQVIEAKGDKVAITPDFDIRDGARFFRVVERP